MTEIQHPALGTIKGTLSGGVVEYLGIQYATLAHQFAPPVAVDLSENQSDRVLNATNYGPSVPGADGCETEFGLIQHGLPRTNYEQSKTDALSLNVIVPQVSHPTALPVLVFLHGGGLGVGSATWPQNHISKLVSLSCELGLPVVGVSINYRVGPAGFLTSQELRDAGFTPNNGLRDQRLALEWVKQNISGFGGESESVTLVGHSAGGASGTYQLASEKPLFHRIACLSGQFLAVRPLPSPVHEHFYAESMRILGLEKLSTEERIARVQELSSDDLARISLFPSRPIIDQDICRTTPSFESIANGITAPLHQGWCKELMIGDCQFDGSILSRAMAQKKNIGKSFAQFLTKQLLDAPDVASQILSSYEIIDDSAEDVGLKNILKLANDIMFYVPTISLARAWKTGAAYVYRFDQANPWEGPWQGNACHITDLSMLLQNFDSFLPDEHKEVGRKFAKDLFVFASGVAPWTAYEGEKPCVQKYGSLQGGRREFIWKIVDRVGADRLANLLEAFIVEG